MPSSRKIKRFHIDPKQKEMFLMEMKLIPKSQLMEDIEYYLEYSLGDSFTSLSKKAKSTKVLAMFRELKK
jgi:hypothetical protein